MSRSKRLKPIADLAAHSEQEASLMMAQTRTRLEQELNLLEKLERYRDEYTHGTISAPDPMRLADYQRFLERLEYAITRQRQAIDDLRREFERDEDRWSDRRMKRRALGKATGRYARAEARAAGRDEQRELEEVAALMRLRSQEP